MILDDEWLPDSLCVIELVLAEKWRVIGVIPPETREMKQKKDMYI